MSDSDSSRCSSSQDNLDSDTSEDDQVLSASSDSADVSLCSSKFGSMTVSVVKDEIGKQQADIIVNTTSTDLKLNFGGVSKGLLAVAGDELQSECTNKYPDGISYGEIAVTGGGKLHCKEVYHVCCKTWSGEQTRQDLKKLVYKCLSKASSSGHTSIAFPAIGTGLNKYPKETVAKAMFTCVEQFQKRHSDTSLVNVRCVIYPADTASLDAFVNRCRKITVDTSDREICVVTVHGLSIHLIVGNIAEQHHDVIVTTSTRAIKLKGGTLSHYVLDVAGPNLQEEVDEKYPKGIQHGEIAVLSPGGLPCKHLYCGAIPRHDRPPEGSEETELLFRKLILACLNQAMKDKAKSVCFPTIGTGYLMYPPDVSARNMLQAITEFGSYNPITAITIYIVLHRKEESLRKNLRVFEQVCREHNTENQTQAARRKTPSVQVKPKLASPLMAGIPQPQPRKKNGKPASADSSTPDQIGGKTSESPNIPARNTPEFCLYMYSSDKISPPQYWTKFTHDKTIKEWKIAQHGKSQYELVDVDKAAFTSIENLVQKTWEVDRVGHGRDAAGLAGLDYNKLKVTKVQRIENLTLYENYKHMQQHMFHKAGEGPMFTPLSKIQGVKIGEPSTFKHMDQSMKSTLYTEVNECYYFHGAKKGKVLSAKVKEGLDPRLANDNAVFGKAVYMSESSTKADQYTDDRQKRETKDLTMILVRCTMGEICLMKDTKKLTRSPCKDTNCLSDTCTHEDRYNSVVEEGKYIFREFCVYDKQQVYPEYVITYDRVKV